MALNKKLLLALVACLSFLANKLHTLPTPNLILGNSEGFCNGQDTLNYQFGNEYFYDYSTQTQLWINDVSEESKSVADFRAIVIVRSVSPCTFLLRLDKPSLTGESVNQASLDLEELTSKPVSFKLNSRGELHPTVGFYENDSTWSRNIKRGILSALQSKSINDLIESNDEKSAVVYETDVLGRCRTTYKVEEATDPANMILTKRKSLHGCTLNSNRKSSAVHFTTYRNLPEFYQGRLFIETYKCTTSIKSSLIDSVECEEKSTYKISSRGQKGVQAVVKQTLKLNGQRQGVNKMAFGDFVDAAINFEYSEKSTNDLETNSVDVKEFLKDLCTRSENKQGLDLEHSNKFRALVNQFESKKRD